MGLPPVKFKSDEGRGSRRRERYRQRETIRWTDSVRGCERKTNSDGFREEDENVWGKKRRRKSLGVWRAGCVGLRGGRDVEKVRCKGLKIGREKKKAAEEYGGDRMAQRDRRTLNFQERICKCWKIERSRRDQRGGNLARLSRAKGKRRCRVDTTRLAVANAKRDVTGGTIRFDATSTESNYRA